MAKKKIKKKAAPQSRVKAAAPAPAKSSVEIMKLREKIIQETRLLATNQKNTYLDLIEAGEELVKLEGGLKEPTNSALGGGRPVSEGITKAPETEEYDDSGDIEDEFETDDF